MADFVPGRPSFDLEDTVLDIRAEMTALELAFEAIIPDSDAADILKVARAPGYQIALIPLDGRRAVLRVLFHLRNTIEELTRGTIGELG